MVFWIAAALLGFGATAPLIWAVLKPRSSRADAAEVQVFKDQLAEVDSDLARGVLTGDEAEALRAEVSRRLLSAADRPADEAQAAPAGLNAGLALVLLAIVLGGGGVVYLGIGAPSLPDQPLAKRLAESAAEYAQRPSQAEVEAILDANNRAPGALVDADPQQTALLDQLRDVLQSRPDDLRGHQLLASNLASLGQWRAAAIAQVDVLRILGEEAAGTDHADLAEYKILAVNGYVSPEAEEALSNALTLDPREPRARYYSGLSALQAGRADLTYDLWLRLL
ncbi:MAG: c-type cytochrome biogenesis protein CcmI, partial [Pseudomonadota bacterium]